jgi:hypothetical protein
MRPLLLTAALALAAACRNEDITAPDVYFDPNARGRLPDGYVFADSADDASVGDASDITDASDAGDVTDASDAGDVTDATDASDAADASDVADDPDASDQ